MNDFLTYFMAGMLGEELMRKIATRPYGFWVLWLVWFVLVNIFFIILDGVFITLGIFTDPAADDSIPRYIWESFYLTFAELQPWAVLLALGMGFLLALSYRHHYKLKISDTKGVGSKRSLG